jgi:uncharacterized membrane protein
MVSVLIVYLFFTEGIAQLEDRVLQRAFSLHTRTIGFVFRLETLRLQKKEKKDR